MREIISRIYPPLGTRPKVRLLVLGYSVGGDIPHLGVGILNILLHAEPGALRRVLTVSHAAKFLEVGLDVLACMLTTISRGRAILSAALQLDLGFGTVAYIRLLLFDQLLGEVIHALEVIGRIGDFGRGKSKPPDCFLNRDKVLPLLCVGICVIESKSLTSVEIRRSPKMKVMDT